MSFIRGRFVKTLLTALLASAVFAGGVAFANHKFSDVGNGTFFHESTGWLADYDVADGFGDGTFRTADNITRGQASYWIYNYNAAIKTVEETTNPGTDTFWEDVADCPTGYRAIAGGGLINAANVDMVASHPSFAVGGGQGWRVAFEGTSQNPTSLTVYATCVPKT